VLLSSVEAPQTLQQEQRINTILQSKPCSSNLDFNLENYYKGVGCYDYIIDLIIQ
jgi:hypothetical protein